MAPEASHPADSAPKVSPSATDAATEPATDAPVPVSKKGAKKEAKAKLKEAQKAQRAQEAQRIAVTSQGGNDEDLSKDFYGKFDAATTKLSPDAQEVALRSINETHVGKPVIVRAWLQNSRAQGSKISFVELREEGNWVIQGVLAATPPDAKENIVSRPMVKWVNNIYPESFLAVEGTVQQPREPVKSCRVRDFELHITKIFVLAPAPSVLGMTMAAANNPITNFGDDAQQEKDEAAKETNTLAASMLTHLDNIVMHKRAPVQQAIADIRMEIKDLFRTYLKEHGFKEFEPPCLIGAASEGGAGVFRLPYFTQEAYLAQSPQFYKQFEIAGGRKRVFCIAPVFRAENSNTPRHMTEFTGLDLEMEIKKDYGEVLLMLEGVLLHIFRGLRERCATEIEIVRGVYPSEDLLLPEPGKEVRLTFAEGQRLLREEGPPEYREVRDDEDMSTPQEKALGALVRAKYNTDFFVLDKFPESARPFYAKVDEKSSSVTNAFDFFLRGQEILSGGQRVNDPDELEARIRSKGIDPNSSGIKEYVNVFRQAGVPTHGGGGIGLDRVVSWFLALPSVHLASYYPRTPKRLMP